MAFDFVRVPEKGKVATPQELNESFNSTPFKVDLSNGYSIAAEMIDTTPATGATFDSGAAEQIELGFDAFSATGNGDFVVIPDQAGLTWSVALQVPRFESNSLNFADASATGNGDYVVLTDAAGLTWAVSLSKGAYDSNTLDFPDLAGATDGDYIVLTDAAGLEWAAALDTTGAAAAEPTGAAWVAIPGARKVYVDVSADVNDEDIAASVEAALNGLTGFSTAFTTDDTAGDGTMTVTCDVVGPAADPVPHNADDSGAGSISSVNVTQGVALQIPTGAAWVAVNAARKDSVDITDIPNDEDIAAAVETALNALSGFSDAFTTDDTAADGTMIITCDAYGPTADPTPHDFDDSGAGSITNTNVVNGVLPVTPSAAQWTAIPAGRKVALDLLDEVGASGTAAQVAAAVEVALNALTGFSDAMTTDDSAADGTMLVTQDVDGVCVDATPHNSDASGVGTISVSIEAQGVDSEVDVDDNEISIPSHGMATGLKVRLTTTDTLPAPLATATDYYVINVDTNTFQLASSYANALAGTEINITDDGTGVHTVAITVALEGTMKLQASNNCYQDNVNMELRDDAFWVDIPGSTVTLDGGDDGALWNVADVNYEAVRVVWTQTEGQGTAAFYFIGKSER